MGENNNIEITNQLVNSGDNRFFTSGNYGGPLTGAM